VKKQHATYTVYEAYTLPLFNHTLHVNRKA
jgi:hypothetical protein